MHDSMPSQSGKIRLFVYQFAGTLIRSIVYSEEKMVLVVIN